MSKILSYRQFYNGTKAKQTLFTYLHTRTSPYAFACSSITPTRTRRNVSSSRSFFNSNPKFSRRCFNCRSNVSCTSHSKAFRKWPFQALTFNASVTNSSGLEQATVVIRLEFVVEWSNYQSANLPKVAKIRTAHHFTHVLKIVKQPQMAGFC